MTAKHVNAATLFDASNYFIFNNTKNRHNISLINLTGLSRIGLTSVRYNWGVDDCKAR
jgi:3-phenylpropionate/cinnamic acid dioxygenase small subunit